MPQIPGNRPTENRTLRSLAAPQSRALGLLVLIASTLLVTSPARAADSTKRTIERLAGRALSGTPLIDDLGYLCDKIGGRPTGSLALDGAITWAAAKFRAEGIEAVTLESFNIPNYWLPGYNDVGACLAPISFKIRVAAAPYSAATPTGGLETRLVDAGTGTASDFEKLGASAKGAVALVMSEEMKTFDDLFAEYLKNSPMVEAAAKAGVSGLLLQSTRPAGLLYRHPISINGTLAPFPAAVVAREHAARLSRLLKEATAGAPVRVQIALDSKVGGEYEGRNVVAEIRGREKPEEIVLLGAHLDSWDLGTGEEDNGVNAALVIDVARGIRDLGLVPRRTIRFVLFTGEEQGLFGSKGYVKRHAAELDRHVAAIIFDTGSGHTSGFYLNGREELGKALDEALAPVSGLGPFTHVKDGIDGTDNFDFLLAGVPNFVASQDPIPYLPDYHAESDVFERVNAREARANVAIASAVVWSLAEAPERPGRRQTRSEVEALLKETNLDEQMKSFGQWEEWAAGKSGEHHP